MSNAPSQDYPYSVEHTDIPSETLDIYHRALNGSEGTPYGDLELFDETDNYIFCRDFSESSDGWLPIATLENLDQVRSHINQQDGDPPCRYIFIHSASSRDPLGCSKGQLEHVLTHHQVMPSFLEHLFTFRWREEPHLQASFRSEDTLESQAPRIEHCFNLVGVEYDSESKTEPFKHRQTAAYYSLDLESGKSTWIIVKANQIVRKRIEQYTGKLETHSQPTTPSSAFSLAMHSHLLIYEWAIQHWTAYIDFLEEQHSDLKKDAAYTPVSTLTADPAMVTEITRRTTGKNQQLDGQPGPPKAETNRSNSWYRRSTPQKTQKQNIPLKTIQTDRIDITKLFTFGNLQKLHRQAMKVQNGLSVLNQNKTVLQDMIRHFEYLESSEDFRKCIDIHKDFRNFVRKTQRCIRELENQQNRLSAVQTDLERVISLFNGILQYHNQRIGESYAQLAKASTDKMERLTLKTKHETVSIHVITILTLFFLPATFIATFFGSGVIEFEKEESTGQLGYWTVRWGALKLFGLVCAPLTCFVLSAWAVTYYRSRRRQKETLPTYAE